jgi:predicted cobalt transporter CbtA
MFMNSFMTAAICSASPATDRQRIMIVRRLLIAGMIAGVIAGLLAAFFARIAIEPTVDLAIAFEAARDAAHHMAEEPELVSRSVQRGPGLIVAATCYGAAVGGIFALVFAGINNRVLGGSPRVSSAWLAFTAFVVISLVPAIKYPPNPPAVGFHETIQLRTATFFAMIALSIAAAAAATALAGRLRQRFADFDARLIALASYGAAMLIVTMALPTIDEVPAAFPATLLWTFRLGALATQAVLWASLGLIFGATAERILRQAA